MPLDSVMPNSDVELLRKWIVGPTLVRLDELGCSPTVGCAEPDDTCNLSTGQCLNTTYLDPAAGAQCDPAINNGMACWNNKVYTCTPDWSFGTYVMTCPADCAASSGGCV